MTKIINFLAVLGWVLWFILLWVWIWLEFTPDTNAYSTGYTCVFWPQSVVWNTYFWNNVTCSKWWNSYNLWSATYAWWSFGATVYTSTFNTAKYWNIGYVYSASNNWVLWTSQTTTGTLSSVILSVDEDFFIKSITWATWPKWATWATWPTWPTGATWATWLSWPQWNDGYNAYELAQLNWFSWTIVEFLESLVWPKWDTWSVAIDLAQSWTISIQSVVNANLIDDSPGLSTWSVYFQVAEKKDGKTYIKIDSIRNLSLIVFLLIGLIFWFYKFLNTWKKIF